jgi:thiamine-phosphate diphosphorylase
VVGIQLHSRKSPAFDRSSPSSKNSRLLLRAFLVHISSSRQREIYRDKSSDGAAFLKGVQEALAASQPSGLPVIVNDRIDIAIAAGAHGVHIGQADLSCAAVRRLVGPSMLVGVSVKTPKQALDAAQAGADYVGAGAVFATTTKASACIGLDGLRAIVATSPIPVVAIGGVSTENVADVMATGCAGAAVVSAVFAADDVAAATAGLQRAME